MIQYFLYRGEWDDYRKHYKWHKLPNASHLVFFAKTNLFISINKFARL